MSWLSLGVAAGGAILGGTGAVGNKGGWGDAFKGALIGGSLGKLGGAGAGGGLGGAGSFTSLGTSLIGKLAGGGGKPAGGGGTYSPIGPLGGSLIAGQQPAAVQLQQAPSYGEDPKQKSLNDAIAQALLSSRGVQSRGWV